jgi:hypothetical protein
MYQTQRPLLLFHQKHLLPLLQELLLPNHTMKTQKALAYQLLTLQDNLPKNLELLHFLQ